MKGKSVAANTGGAWIQGLKCYSCPDNQLRKKLGALQLLCTYVFKMLCLEHASYN